MKKLNIIEPKEKTNVYKGVECFKGSRLSTRYFVQSHPGYCSEYLRQVAKGHIEPTIFDMTTYDSKKNLITGCSVDCGLLDYVASDLNNCAHYKIMYVDTGFDFDERRIVYAYLKFLPTFDFNQKFFGKFCFKDGHVSIRPDHHKILWLPKAEVWYGMQLPDAEFDDNYVYDERRALIADMDAATSQLPEFLITNGNYPVLTEMIHLNDDFGIPQLNEHNYLNVLHDDDGNETDLECDLMALILNNYAEIANHNYEIVRATEEECPLNCWLRAKRESETFGCLYTGLMSRQIIIRHFGHGDVLELSRVTFRNREDFLSNLEHNLRLARDQPDIQMLVSFAYSPDSYIGHCELISYNEFVNELTANYHVLEPSYLAGESVYVYAGKRAKVRKLLNSKPTLSGNAEVKQDIYTAMNSVGIKKGESFDKIAGRLATKDADANAVWASKFNQDLAKHINKPTYVVKAKEKSLAADKILASMYKNANDKYGSSFSNGKLPKTLFYIMVIEDDWKGVLDRVKQYGTSAYNYVAKNWEPIVSAGSDILQGNYMNGIGKLAQTLLPDPSSNTHDMRDTAVASKEAFNVGPTGIDTVNGAFGPSTNIYTTIRPGHSLRTLKRMNDVSRGYLVGILAAEPSRPDAIPSTLPDMCMTKTITAYTSTTALSQGNNYWVRIAPWNLFSASVNTNATAPTFVLSTVYPNGVDDPSSPTYRNIPGPWNVGTSILSGQANNYAKVRVNSLHVEIVPVFTNATTAFTVASAIFDSTPLSDMLPVPATGTSPTWFTDISMLSVPGARVQSSSTWNGMTMHYVAEGIDQPGDGWGIYATANNGFADGPSLCFKIERLTGNLTFNIIVRASFSVYPSTSGLISIPVVLPEAGSMTANMIDALFSERPWLKYSSQELWNRLASAVQTAPSDDADSMLQLLLSIIDKEPVTHNHTNLVNSEIERADNIAEFN